MALFVRTAGFGHLGGHLVLAGWSAPGRCQRPPSPLAPEYMFCTGTMPPFTLREVSGRYKQRQTQMFPFSRNNTSTPTGSSSRFIETSSSNTPRKTDNSPLYFSRLFSSPGSRNISTPSPSSSSCPFRRNAPSRKDPPPLLFNFYSPVRHRLPQSPQPSSLRPRNAIEFLNHSNSSMIERALRVLESKRKKYPNEALVEDELDSEHVSLKRYRSTEENNSSPLLARSVPMLPQDAEVISRPKLKPSTPTSRPSSSKLPDQVSRLPSAALEAIAFGLKRRRLEEEEKEGEDVARKRPTPTQSVISIIDENLLPFSLAPAAKRRATRDCETQTVFQVDSATSTSESLPLSHQRRRPASSNRSTSVTRFIAGLEARARANALSRRFVASPAGVLTQSDSLEARHAKIRRMFAELTEKAVVDLTDNSLSPVTASPIGANTTTSNHPDITSSSTPLLPPTASSVAMSSVTLPSSKVTEPVAVSSGTALITAVVSTTESVVATTCSFAPALPLLGKSSHVGEQDSTTTTTAVTSASMMNLPFVFGIKSTVSTEITASTTSAPVSTSVAPSFTFSMESTSQKSVDQRSSTNTSTTALPSTLPVAKSTPSFGQTSFGGTIFSSASSASSASSVVVTSSTSSFAFTLAKSTASGGIATASSMPNFDFTISKPSMPVVATTTSFIPLVTTSSSLSSLASSGKDNLAPSSAPLFNFPATLTTATNTTTVSAAATTSGGTFFSPAMTSTDNAAASSTSSTAAAVQLGFRFGNTAPTTAPSTSVTSSMFNFSAKPASINTTMGTMLSTAPSTPTLSACNFSAKPDTFKTSSVFSAPAITKTPSILPPAKSMPAFNFVLSTSATTAPTLFDFSAKPTTTAYAKIGEATTPVVNFKAAVTTGAATTTTTSVPSVFPMKSAFSNGNTAVPSFVFPSAQNTPSNAATTTTTSTSLFPSPKTNTSELANGGSSGGPFGKALFGFQNSSNLTAVTSIGGCFTFTSPSMTITATTTTPVSFSFTSTVTATSALGGSGLGAFSFSSGGATATGSSSTPFAPKPGTGVFQFGARPTAAPTTVTTTSPGFPLTLSSTRSSPSIFSTNDHTKRTGDSFTDGLSAPKLQAPSFGGGTVNPAPFSGTSVQPFTFGGSSGAVTAPPGGTVGAGSGGFNFSAAVTNPIGGFNFSQTQPAPVFSGAEGTPPNPFSAVPPTAPNATASFYQRRRQMRYSKRR
ncbi:hypothetical protein TSMEX_008158 [Taenia solium]|eukprot:TsM_000868900 transcript=TsM_000868900 gene=TsM_000868900